MGVGGHFWDLLKPYARSEGFDFLRDKRVAVDLSYWIVQHETAIKSYARNPHIRLTFFRTINLFSKFGAFPVFVVDGTPSPLKSQARILRFFRASGIELLGLPVSEEGVSVKRNGAFLKCVQECVELLEFLGIPVLKARGEAEALCAQLNRGGRVDACITADSDAFLFGSECVIKCFRPNSKEPLECYYMSDIEAGLGLKRKHLIAISLLVGNDHDLNGVQGIGLDTAVRFVKSFSEDEILNRLHEIGKGDTSHFQSDILCVGDFIPCSDDKSPKTKLPHCSICGHPGSKRAHLKFACEYCSAALTSKCCIQKPADFKCDCSSCDLDRKAKEQQKNENWWTRVCNKITMEQNFPNNEIIEMYTSEKQGDFIDDDAHIVWESPQIEMLIDYLSYHQHWEPSYIRQRMLPMLSTIYLREMASNSSKDLLHGQYEFDSVQRVKIRFGHQFVVVKWRKAARAVQNANYTIHSEVSNAQQECEEINESIDVLDEPDVPQICIDDGCLFLLTDENMELVRSAFPEKVNQFLQEKELKEMTSRKRSSSLRSEGTPPKNSESPTSSVQLSITEFYRSSKVLCQAKPGENSGDDSKSSIDSPKERSKMYNQKLSKSVRRRLLFK